MNYIDKRVIYSLTFFTNYESTLNIVSITAIVSSDHALNVERIHDRTECLKINSLLES